MKENYLLYLSTNTLWGGSEILWSHSASRFIEEGWTVHAATFYGHTNIKELLPLQGSFTNLALKNNPGLIDRILKKLRILPTIEKDNLSILLSNRKPDLAIISHGNSKDGLALMQACYENNIPYINIIHLAFEGLWPGMNDERINRLNILFEKSRANYFVSKQTMLMHERLLGKEFINNKIIYNPFTKSITKEIEYPPVTNGHYKVALCGRIENFHKGYDLLIDLAAMDKWRNRNITFSIFGDGPHKELLERMITMNRISNVVICGHTTDITTIWNAHQILMMPSRMEGQSLTLIEAMWLKRAAIVTNVGGVEELVKEGITGFIAAFPTLQHLDMAMEKAWNARDEWETLGINAHTHIVQEHPADATNYFNNEIKSMVASLAAKSNAKV